MKIFFKIKILFLLSSLLLLLYVIFRSEIIYSGNNRDYYFLYYIICLGFIFFSVSFFFINNFFFKYLLIILTSCLVGIYLFEAYLTFFTITRGDIRIDPKKIEIYKNTTGLNYDTRQKFQIYDDLKKVNPKIQVSIGPSNILDKNLYNLSGISNVQTILCNENGYYAIYNSDRYGFRNQDSKWDEKQIEYLIIGDSFAIGECVQSNQTISFYLDEISKKNSISLGFGGNGPLTEYATMREYFPQNTKKTIWLYFEGNDQTNLDRELESKILNKYLQDFNFTQNLKSKQIIIDNYLLELVEKEREWLSFKFERSIKYKFIKFLKFFNTRDLLINQRISKSGTKLNPKFKMIIKKASELSKKNNSEFYFIFIPDISYILNRCLVESDHYQKVKKIIINELKLPFISLCEKIFKKEKNPKQLFPLEQKGHFNELGYRLIAKTIYENTQ